VRLERLKFGGPFLMDHNPRDHRGVIEMVKVEDKRGVATVRISRRTAGEELLQDIVDGIRTHISVGYFIHAMRLESEKDGVKTYRATDWEPLEVSSVSIPADLSVGIGRSEDRDYPHETLIEPHTEEERTMHKCPHCQRDLVNGACTCEGYRAANPPANPPVVPANRNHDPGGGAPPTVDENGILARERQRVQSIEALARRFPQVGGIQDLARQFREGGKSAQDFQTTILERLGTPQPTDVPEPVRGLLNPQEDQQYSILRAINSLCEHGAAAGFEREVSQTIAKRLGRSTAGIYVPTSLGVRAPATAGTVGDGGYTVQTTVMPLIEMLRAKLMIKALGAQVLDGLTGDLSFPRQEKSASLNWVGEAPGADVADTDATGMFGQVKLAPKNAIATVPYSKQLLAQSSLSIEQFLRADLAAVNAAGVDLAAISGAAGGDNPVGILGTTGIGSVVCGDPDGAVLDWGDVVKLETEIAVDNADAGTLAYLTNPKVRGKLKTTPKVAATETMIWEKGAAGFGEVNGYRAAVSTQVPGNLSKGASNAILSALIFGDFSQILIGEWGVLEILVDPYALKKQGLVEITSNLLCDVAIRHPQAFAAAKDAMTA
jgi:HK97 family phage major capsid protein